MKDNSELLRSCVARSLTHFLGNTRGSALFISIHWVEYAAVLAATPSPRHI